MTDMREAEMDLVHMTLIIVAGIVLFPLLFRLFFITVALFAIPAVPWLIYRMFTTWPAGYHPGG